ncbi:MAG: hypothetical protein K2K89_07850 [Ruminococcus sp.]|nr:hypothetical protein [Ruminococcus sp.]
MNESEKIHILIGLLNETEKFNTEKLFNSYSEFEATADLVMLQSILYDATETVAKKINSTPHHVERVMNDVITGGDMRYNLVDFSRIIVEYLTTGNKTPLKELLVKNISEENYDSDLQAIERWYKGS